MKKHLFLMLLCITSTLFSQEFSMDILKDVKPRNIGPGGMSGRVTAIDVVTDNTDIMYVGTASGGLWKSKSGGVTRIPKVRLLFSNLIRRLFGLEQVKGIQEIV
jgi:hypothetical protein